MYRYVCITVCRYGANITRVCESQTPARALNGESLTAVNDAMLRKVGLVHSTPEIAVLVVHIHNQVCDVAFALWELVTLLYVRR